MKENYLVCDDCKSLDERELAELKKCIRCGEKFCPHNSSDVNLDFCFHCQADVNLRITSINREVKRVNTTTGKVTVVPIKVATEYQFDGTDWLYMVQKIKDFASDPNGDYRFTKMIEYYKALYGTMLSYREDARLAKLDKARAEGASIVRTPATNGAADKIISSTIHSPEAAARKKVVNVLKLTLKREPTQAEIELGMKAFGLNI